jgi:hypothetical protein
MYTMLFEAGSNVKVAFDFSTFSQLNPSELTYLVSVIKDINVLL